MIVKLLQEWDLDVQIGRGPYSELPGSEETDTNAGLRSISQAASMGGFKVI